MVRRKYEWVKYEYKVLMRSSNGMLDRFASDTYNKFFNAYLVKYDDYNNEPIYKGIVSLGR